MSATKRTPQLRFPEFTGEWQEKRLGEVFLFKRTNSLSRAQLDTRGVVKNVHYGDIHTKFPTVLDSTQDDISYIRSSVGDNVGDFLCDGDLVVADASEDYNDIGKTVEISGVDNNEVKIVAGLHTLALSPYSNYANGFMGYLFKTESVHRQMVRVATGVSVLGLSKSNVSDMCILAPPLEEQQKIAAFLAAVDKRVALLERKVQQLEAYKRGVMQQLFSQQLRFTRPDGSHFPAWQEKRLGEIGKIITGKTPATSNRSLWGGTIDFITPSDIDDGKYQKPTERTLAEISNLRVLPPGSISFTCIASIGKMSITKRPSVTNQQINSIITRQCIDNEYLYYCLLNMTPRIRATQANTTLPIINKAEFSGFKVRVPCMAEQQKIAAFLSALDEKIALTRQQLDKTKQFKKGLLQRMFV